MDQTDATEDVLTLPSPQEFSESQAWAMVESSPDGMLLVDDHGHMIAVNSQIEAMFGVDRGQLLGKPIEELLPKRFHKIHGAHRTRYRVNPLPRAMGAELDLWARRADGTEFPVEVSLSPIASDDQTTIVATVRDVTSRHEAEAEIHAVLHTVDSARDGVFMFDPVTLEFTYVNQGAIDQLGYSRPQLLEMTPIHIKPQFTESEFRSKIEPLISDKIDSITFTTLHRRRDGEDVPVEIVLEYPNAGAGDRPRRLVAVVRDVSERVLATRALSASEEAFRTAFDGAPVGMALVDFSDPVSRPLTRVNSAMSSLLGYTEDELLAKGFAELTYHEDSEASDIAARRAADGELKSYALEQRYVHADGHPVPVLVHSAVLDNGTQVPTSVLVHVVDLTEAKRAQADEARLKVHQDRERLAEDLHDLIIQRLFAAGMGLQSVQNHVVDSVAQARLSQTVDELDCAIADLRTAIFHLHSPVEVGIEHNLLETIDAGTRTLGFKPTLTIAGDLNEIPNVVAEQLLPVITEALSNVARHAKSATTVEIDLTVGETIELTVTDNGSGASACDGPNGHGLRNLKARAERVGGTSSLDNAEAGGAILHWCSGKLLGGGATTHA